MPVITVGGQTLTANNSKLAILHYFEKTTTGNEFFSIGNTLKFGVAILKILDFSESMDFSMCLGGGKKGDF